MLLSRIIRNYGLHREPDLNIPFRTSCDNPRNRSQQQVALYGPFRIGVLSGSLVLLTEACYAALHLLRRLEFFAETP